MCRSIEKRRQSKEKTFMLRLKVKFFKFSEDNQRMLQAALIPQHGMNSSSNIQPVKKTIHPPTLETISEKEPLMEEESNNANGNGMTGAGDASVRIIS